MFRRNPVYEKEHWTIDQSAYFPAGVFAFGIIMTTAAITVFTDMTRLAEGQGIEKLGQMLQMYVVLAMLEGLMVLVVMPGISGVSIAKEKENGMYDIMRVSGVSPWKLVRGKLDACINIIAVLIVAGFPGLCMVYVYGGIRIMDAVNLGAILMLVALFLASAGILCSSVFRKRFVAVSAAYIIMIAVTGGTVLIHYFPSFFLSRDFGDSIGVSIAWYHYLLLANPLLTVYCVLNEQAGSSEFLFQLINYRGNYRPNYITEHWVMISMIVLLCLTVLNLTLSVIILGGHKPGRKRRRRHRVNKKNLKPAPVNRSS